MRRSPAGFEAELREAYAESSKQARHERVEAVRVAALEALGGQDGEFAPAVLSAFKKLEKAIVRNAILDTGRRIDGRDTTEHPPDQRPRSASCRGCMAARCSRAARPRRWWSPRSAPARTSR